MPTIHAADKSVRYAPTGRNLMRELDLNELGQVGGGNGTNTGVSG